MPDYRLFVRLAIAFTAVWGSAANAINLEFEVYAQGTTGPVFVTHAGDGTGRLFVAEQTGRVRVIHPGGILQTTPFLNASGIVSQTRDERGLLGLAFHPQYAQNGRFFISYTAKPINPADFHPSYVVEYRVSESDPDVADPTPQRLILGPIPHPSPHHNAGMIAFGPDGLFYFSLGDGGGVGDPWGNAQNLGTFLGKLIRIDVDQPGQGLGYAIPSGNYFEADGDPATLGEIYAYGLRNPWRFSFDRLTGRIYLGDVGQFTREEVNIIWNGGNYGWPIMEGAICYVPEEESLQLTDCDQTGLRFPIHDYQHDDGNNAVTGGYVYRGEANPALKGVYIFCDSGRAKVWGLRETHPGYFEHLELGNAPWAIVSFGEDEEGEIYACSLGNGQIYRIKDNDPPPAAAKIPWQLAE